MRITENKGVYDMISVSTCCPVNRSPDSGQLTGAIKELIAKKKGLNAVQNPSSDRSQKKQEAYDLLADTVRKSLDMERIYAILDRR